MKTAYCAHQGVDETAYTFSYNGVEINDEDTPGSLQMEDGDDIVGLKVEGT